MHAQPTRNTKFGCLYTVVSPLLREKTNESRSTQDHDRARNAPAHKEKHEQPFQSTTYTTSPSQKGLEAVPPITATTSCNPTNKELANSFPPGLGAQHLSNHHRHRGAARRDNNA